MAVNDFPRVTFTELLSDERNGTCLAFMGSYPASFAGLGVAVERMMTDNDLGHRNG